MKIDDNMPNIKNQSQQMCRKCLKPLIDLDNSMKCRVCFNYFHIACIENSPVKRYNICTDNCDLNLIEQQLKMNNEMNQLLTNSLDEGREVRKHVNVIKQHINDVRHEILVKTFVVYVMNPSTLDKLCIFLAELIGTGLLLFLGCMGCISWSKDVPTMHLQSTITFGLVIMIIIQTFGYVSGAHLNPAVTAAAYIYKMVDLQMAFIYFVAQLLGSFMGFGLLKLVTPLNIFLPNSNATVGLCMTIPHSDVSVLQAVSMEFLATMVLILVCCGVWEPKNSSFGDSVSLRFGLVVTALATATGPYTGCSMNPVRSFAPALWHGNLESQWIYWVAPMLAGVVTSYVYRSLFYREPVVTKHIEKIPEEIPLKENNV